MSKSLIVLKFGGSVLTGETSVFEAVSEIYRYVRQGFGVLAVVSALKGETDGLLALGRRCLGREHGSGLPALVSLGEQRSAALLALAAERTGLGVELLQPYEIGLRAAGEPEDAAPVEVDARRLRQALAAQDLVVIPGFVALDAQGKTVLLGRGGTDLSAVFLAQALGARVRLLKDVDGVYDRDPALASDAEAYDEIEWAHAERIAHPLVQDKAIRLAAENRLEIEVAAVGAGYETRIGGQTRLRLARPSSKRLRVGVLGCGVVGGGVIDRLLDCPERFDLRSVLVRNLDQRAAHPAVEVFTREAEQLAAADIDVFVDAGCGIEPSAKLMEAFLRRGVHVVSANKQALASAGDRLRAAAQASDARLLYAAAVGGGAPVLETAAQLRSAGVASVEGVLNGTSNFVLGLCSRGVPLAEAVRQAQLAGFAEEDPSQDLNGGDAAAKLVLIAEIALGVRPQGPIVCMPIDAAALERGEPLKQIGRCWREQDGKVRAEVRLEALRPEDFLAGAVDEENRARFVLADGSEVRVGGKGAGRWPTTEAVLADLFEIGRASAQPRADPVDGRACTAAPPAPDRRHAPVRLRPTQLARETVPISPA